MHFDFIHLFLDLLQSLSLITEKFFELLKTARSGQVYFQIFLVIPLDPFVFEKIYQQRVSFTTFFRNLLHASSRVVLRVIPKGKSIFGGKPFMGCKVVLGVVRRVCKLSKVACG